MVEKTPSILHFFFLTINTLLTNFILMVLEKSNMPPKIPFTKPSPTQSLVDIYPNALVASIKTNVGICFLTPKLPPCMVTKNSFNCHKIIDKIHF